MKNFYEATVIKPQLTLAVCLTLRVPHDVVFGIVKVNGETVLLNGQSALITDSYLHIDLPLMNPIDIDIQLIDRQHPNAVEVELTIDGYKILPEYQYLATPRTCYIDTNSRWNLHIPNFYQWLHEVSGQGWII